jgi:hypothetical protein
MDVRFRKNGGPWLNFHLDNLEAAMPYEEGVEPVIASTEEPEYKPRISITTLPGTGTVPGADL